MPALRDSDTWFTPTKTSSVPATRSQTPAQVDGEVVSSRVRLPVFRTYVRPVFVNTRENKPDTLIQALAPAFALAAPVAGAFMLLWIFLAPMALIFSVLLLAVAAGVVHRPRHSPWKVFMRLCQLLLIGILFAPARGVVHCCCRLLRF